MTFFIYVMYLGAKIYLPYWILPLGNIVAVWYRVDNSVYV